MRTIQYAGLTDIGRVRRENEDHWFAAPQQGLYVVADGMGGTPGGGLASLVVIDTVPVLFDRQLRDMSDLGAPLAAARLAECLAQLSDHLRSESRGQRGMDGMGSTVVMALIRDGKALLGHLGDSRGYLLHEGTLEQLTTDHSIVQLLIDAGDLAIEDASQHPARGQLSRFVGMPGEALPDVRLVDLSPGDKLLLCSDGLTDMVSDTQIADCLRRDVTPTLICEELIHRANSAGGKDNITSLIVEMPAVSGTRGSA